MYMQMLNIIKGPLIIKEWTYYELGPSSDVQSCHRIVDCVTEVRDSNLNGGTNVQR